MGRPRSVISRVVVEDCETLKVSDTSPCRRLGIGFSTVGARGHGRRLCLRRPGLGGRGKIDRDQVVADYSQRKAMSAGEIEQWLGQNLNYDPAE